MSDSSLMDTRSSSAIMTGPTHTHIMLFKYNADISWQALQTHFISFLSLRTRCLKPPSTGQPYMLSLHAGQNRSLEPFSKALRTGSC